jgi:hypothetical protein
MSSLLRRGEQRPFRGAVHEATKLSNTLQRLTFMPEPWSCYQADAIAQLLAAFGDNPLQFAGFLAGQPISGAVDDGMAFLTGD